MIKLTAYYTFNDWIMKSGKYLSMMKSASKQMFNPYNNTYSLNIKRINIENKNVVIIVAHPDDELIFSSSIITSDEPKSKKIFVVHDGGPKRNKVLEKISKKFDCELIHLKIKEKKSDNKAIINASGIKKINDSLNNIKGEEIIFTHNKWGEYGHDHHKKVHELVKQRFKNQELYYFGYIPPIVYNNSKTPWNKTLKAYGLKFNWENSSYHNFKPFYGIFKSKKDESFSFASTNYYFPQKNKQAIKSLINMYLTCKDQSWMFWAISNSNLRNYAENNMQLFIKEERHLIYNPRINEFPKLFIRSKEPYINKGLKSVKQKIHKLLSFSDDIRTFHDKFLVDYLKLDGDLLWVGWNQYCVKKGYYKKMRKYADSIDLLDYKTSRKDKKIYGDQAVNIVGNIINLKGKISDESYDSVHCLGVFEYIEKDKISLAINELFRITKKGGRMLLGVAGVDYENTGFTRLDLDWLLNEIKKNDLVTIEVWRKFNPDFYFLHVYKP